MFRFAVAFAAFASLAAAADTSSGGRTVTFNKDVLPILQRNCQTCHRPGEIGPMPLLTYENARPWAKAIRAAVLSRKMPPWFAEAPAGHFANDRRMSEAEMNTIAAWADSGAAEGDPKDRPAPLQWKEGWNIDPDLTFEMPLTFEIPATGTLDYAYFLAPVHFKEDTWVTAGELRPGARANVHHAIVYVRPPGSTWMKGLQPGETYIPKKAQVGAPPAPLPTDVNEWLVTYVPGMNPAHFDAENSAKLIPAGSDLIFEMHYTTNGKAAEDRSKVGLVLAKAPPAKRFIELPATGNPAAIQIPPGDPNYEGKGMLKFNEDVDFIEQQAHMHLRGKDMLVKLTYPTGETETVLNVPHYDFHWQIVYYNEKPLHIPKGTVMEVTVHWDNSANNKNNPDPTATVRWGEQSWDEMMVDHFGVVVDRSVDVKKVVQSLKAAPSEARN